jgi:hypothetical protein
LYEFINSKTIKIKILGKDLDHRPPNCTHPTTPPPTCLAAMILQSIYYLYYMILMSEKMMSQNKFYEFKSVPYNKPPLSPHPLLVDRVQGKKKSTIVIN